MGSAGTEGICRALFYNTTEKVLFLAPILNYLSVLKGELREWYLWHVTDWKDDYRVECCGVYGIAAK